MDEIVTKCPCPCFTKKLNAQLAISTKPFTFVSTVNLSNSQLNSLLGSPMPALMIRRSHPPSFAFNDSR
jgi:hypothetical protein